MSKVAIVGKPNVGKSTLFNRVIQHKKAIVDDQPGATRDRIYETVDWLTRKFDLIDTGGLTKKDEPFQKAIEKQVKFAIDESNVIIFLVSQKDGINVDDYYVTKLLKKNKSKKVILVVNKSENKNYDNTNLYYSLGFDKPYYISAEHGLGIGDLLDVIVKQLDDVKTKPSKSEFAFCIIGRPNVGKSSLVNTILNEERVLVSPIPNTTRDSIDCDFTYNKKKYTIIDTAGIRKKGKIYEDVEKYAVIRAEQSIGRSNLIILMLDGSEEFNEQDEIIGGLAFASNMPVIIAVNKWDLVKKDDLTMSKMTTLIRSKFQYLSYAPIVFISATENKRVFTIFETIELIQKQISIQVSTSMLNDVIAKAQMFNQPPLFKGKRLNISYATQVKSQIPTFVIFCNDPKYLHFSYARYIENKIREAFGITIVPITVYYKDKNSRIRGIKEK